MVREPNVLPEFLARADWNARELGRAVNRWLSERGRSSEKIHPTTPYSWVRYGFRPYEPYPRIVAEVLSKRLGQLVTPALLWPERNPGSKSSEQRQAHDDLCGQWSVATALSQLSELADSADPERRHFTAAAGPALVTSALDGWTCRSDPIQQEAPAGQVQPPLMKLISEHTAALRRLDDRTGGGALSLRYVRGELRAVLDLLTYSTYDAQVGKDLLLAAANLAQLSGWMHQDAGEHGAGQRYLLLALRAARAGGDDECAANVIGMLAYHAAQSGQPGEAVRLAEAATRVTGQASAATRARVAGRLATAHAAAGDLYAFRSAAERARALLDKRDPGDDPPYLYYLNPEQLAAETGQALVSLAPLNPAHRHVLLAEAVELLTPFTSAGPRACYQRSALLHGCYLAQAHLHRGELEPAVHTARIAIARLPGVQSGRCRALLHDLRASLAVRKRDRHAAEFLPELDRALASA